MDGIIYDVKLLLGHNNDQGAFSLTRMRETITQENIRLLTDSGYSSSHLVTPDDEKSRTWNHTQKGLRSVVEVAIGMVQHYVLAAERVYQNPETRAGADVLLSTHKHESETVSAACAPQINARGSKFAPSL